ncbi:MAG: 5'/3'-nucleotidase SurE [Nitrospirae bacterium]|nr:5'/3'-nucleotidase SurE [Nitrospirota bacterium]MBI3351452.1 5'/3'-nucleotidase SurE [Nitrospirota bacterium]
MDILVSNDDGIQSPGIHALAEVLRELGNIYVVAPDRERNAVGHALTLHKPLRVEEIKKNFFSLNGTPTDCVNWGVLHLLKKPPALLVSGINKGANLGDDVTYSGTVSAAFEGTILKVPSIAVSQMGPPPYEFKSAAQFALQIAKQILNKGLPNDILLNVNVPNLPIEKIKDIKIVSLGRRVFEDNAIIEKTDPRGRKYYWIGGTKILWEDKPDTDNDAVSHGHVSVTPLHLDLTHYEFLKKMKKWEKALNRDKKDD